MKRLILALCLICVLSTVVLAQTFTYTATVTQIPAEWPFTQFYSEIHNLSQTVPGDSFLVSMDAGNVPSNWQVSFCTGAGGCYPPFITEAYDTIGIGEMDYVLVDIYPDSTTMVTSTVTMTVEPMDHPELAQSITFTLYFGEGVKDNASQPEGYQLLSAYPNPFNPELTLSINLDHQADAALSIFNLRGEKVADLQSGKLQSGTHEFKWLASDQASGIYLAQLQMAGNTITQKVVLLK
jgi:hypothetical protein